MQNKNTLIIILVIALAVVGFIAFKNNAKAPVVDTTPTPTQTMPTDGITASGDNKGDLIAFSIWQESKVHGIVSYRGTIKGGYFFEGNILIKILGADKKVLKESNAVAKTDWMTAEPVDFEGNIDFTGLPTGRAYVRIQNDNPSDMRENDKWIDIPIIIEAVPAVGTYAYKNHGFTIELPKGYTVKEEQSEGGPGIVITLPKSILNYVQDASFWEQHNIPIYTYVKDQKIGDTVFKVYTYSGATFYWFKQGNVGYEFSGDTSILETFKFVGWN